MDCKNNKKENKFSQEIIVNKNISSPKEPSMETPQGSIADSPIFKETISDKASFSNYNNLSKKLHSPIADHKQILSASETIVEKEYGGYKGREPTIYGDWQHKGRVSDF